MVRTHYLGWLGSVEHGRHEAALGSREEAAPALDPRLALALAPTTALARLGLSDRLVRRGGVEGRGRRQGRAPRLARVGVARAEERRDLVVEERRVVPEAEVREGALEVTRAAGGVGGLAHHVLESLHEGRLGRRARRVVREHALAVLEDDHLRALDRQHHVHPLTELPELRHHGLARELRWAGGGGVGRGGAERGG